jgi:uncharacterized protein YjbI with pentapeptide repeats
MDKAEKPKESWQERKKRIKHKWAVPFIFVEWNCERLSDLLEQWAFLDILGHAGRLSVLVAVVLYFAEVPKRKMQARDQQIAKHNQAWQIINAASGRPGSGGRINALYELNRDKVSLAGVDISKAYIPSLSLAEADLSDANFTMASLKRANLAGADLAGANLSQALLEHANLRDADLRHANLTDANLSYADLSNANLVEASLTGANLAQVDLKGANLARADLCYADLWYADLTTIKSWQKIKSIELANIYGVKNAPDGFIEWAMTNGAVSIAIVDYEEWRKLTREKMEEKKKQEAENSRGNQKEAGEK